MSSPSQGRGRALASIPTDTIVIDPDQPNNNNQGQVEEDIEAAGESPIGDAAEGYNIHESVLYSHGYFQKIKKEDGTLVAKCMMCWEKSKDTVVTRKIGDSSTKGRFI